MTPTPLRDFGAVLFASVLFLAPAACELTDDLGLDGTRTSTDTGGGGGVQPNPCASDGSCNTNCTNDPDCAAPPDPCRRDGSCNQSCANNPDCQPDDSCNHNPGVCEVATKCSTTECATDPDCEEWYACDSDEHCDTWCTTGSDPDCAGTAGDGKYCGGTQECVADDYCDESCASDPDCGGGPCSCNYNANVCEVSQKCSESECSCDPDCGQAYACDWDGHCDTWCSTGADPDCTGTSGDGKYCE